MEFIGYTIGLEATANTGMYKQGRMVKVEYTKIGNDMVRLSAVSGNNLSKIKGSAVITQEQFDERPQDAYNDVSEAKWALEKCGWFLI